jgi:hypothetical protein
LIYLVVFDVVGVLACWFLDFVEEGNIGVFFAVWFVLGVFCGMLSYSTAADLPSPKMPEKAGRLAIFATFVMVAAISIGSYLIWWRNGMEESSLLPDGEALTLTFLLTVLASCIFAHKVLRDMPVRNARSKPNGPLRRR